MLKEERAFMVNELSKLGLRVYEGKGDFLMFYCEKDLVEPLLERGIYIRSCDNYEGLGNGFYRIGLKLRNKNEELIAALKEIING